MAPKVLITDDGKLEASVPIGDTPKPAGQESNVHASRGQYPKAALVFGFADVWPAHHMILLLVPLASPEKPRLVFGDLLMEGLMKAIETHGKPE